MANAPLILVIDIGSSSTRAILFDTAAQSLVGAVAQIPIKFTTTADGGATIDAGTLFAKVVDTIDLLSNSHRDEMKRVIGVASGSFVGNLIGVDEDYKPLTPVYTYADTRNREDAAALKEELGPDGTAAAHQRTATVVHTSYAPARLRWLARTEPELFEDTAYWISFGDYCLWRLFGQRGNSYSVAAWNGLLNRHSLTWDKEWLDYLGVRADQLSPLTDLNQPFTKLKSPWAERWPALKDVPWFPSIGDGAAANIGSGCDSPDRIALTMGTTGAMRVVIDPSELTSVPSGLWCYRVDKQRGLLGGATTEGGNLYAWLRSTLQLPPQDQIGRELAAMRPAAHGLTVLPFIAGERAPGWNENARASIHGFNLNTKPIEIVQAGLESVAYRFALIYQRISANLPSSSSRQVVAGGGALLGSPAWIQIFSDVLGEPIVTLLEKENTSRGLALLALERLGIISRTSDVAPETGTIYQPNMHNHELHREALARQVEQYDKM